MKKYLISFFVLIGLLFAPLASTVHGMAANADATCEGAQLAGASVDCKDKELSDDQFGNIVRTIINILSVIVGAVSVIMIIIGGFRYIVSNGDSNAVSGAKNTILYAVIGLIIVLFAQIMVRFLVTKVDPNKTSSHNIPISTLYRQSSEV